MQGAEPSSRREAAGSPGAESTEQLRGAADRSRMEDPAASGAGSQPANGNGNGNGGGKGKQAAPKGREAFRSQRRESEVRSPESFSWGREAPASARRREAVAEVVWPRPPPARTPRRALACPWERAPAESAAVWTRGCATPDRSAPVSCGGSGAFSPFGLRSGGARL